MNNNLEEQKLKQPSSISEKVLGKISSGQIKMRPRAIFILKIIAVILAVFFAAIFVVFLISFIVFSLRSSGLWFLPGLGFRGLGILFNSLPWLLIFITVVSVIVLELLIRRFSFSYRRPLVYSIFGVFILVLLGGLPIAGEFYRQFGAPKLNFVHSGLVATTTDGSFDLETGRGETLRIFIASSTRFSLDKNQEIIKKDDQVIILGKRDNDSVQAFDIRRVDKRFEPFDRQPSPRPMRLRGR